MEGKGPLYFYLRIYTHDSHAGPRHRLTSSSAAATKHFTICDNAVVSKLT